MKQNHCSCGDDYEKAKKKIEEDTKNLKFCYIQGPTGPKGEDGEPGPIGPQGESGPATIEIGETETIEPGMNAEVVNVGTNQDVILNFKIPRGIEGLQGPIGLQGPMGLQGEQGPIGPKGDKGDPGEKGEQGPRGLPGEIGISQVITIDGTETVEPDEEAEVQDDFESNIHHLTFYIPKGEKGEKGDIGPTGPAGPATSTIAYANCYIASAQEIQLMGQQDTLIPLKDKGLNENAEFTDDGAILVKESGVYLISYYLGVSSNESCTLTLTVRGGNSLAHASNVSIDLIGDVPGNISNTTIATLIKDEKVTLNARSDQTATTLSFGHGTSAVLTILKID